MSTRQYYKYHPIFNSIEFLDIWTHDSLFDIDLDNRFTIEVIHIGIVRSYYNFNTLIYQTIIIMTVIFIMK